MKNKKGAEYLSVWWIFVLVIISVGIVIGISANNSADIDTKKLESDILITRLVSCVVENGELKQEFLQDDFDIFQKCKISEEVINKSGKYYLGYEIKNNGEVVKEDFFGVKSFEVQCKLEDESEAEGYPGCVEKKIYVLNKEKEKLIFEILAGSKQEIRREVANEIQ